LRPRLAYLANLVTELGRSARSGRRAADPSPAPDPAPTPAERMSAEEMKRRLDYTRERLKRDAPPASDRND
jgi:hypothetical protein